MLMREWTVVYQLKTIGDNEQKIRVISRGVPTEELVRNTILLEARDEEEYQFLQNHLHSLEIKRSFYEG